VDLLVDRELRAVVQHKAVCSQQCGNLEFRERVVLSEFQKGGILRLHGELAQKSRLI
jgi:hypothetical protein